MAELIPQNELNSYLSRVPQWELKDNSISRDAIFRNFNQAMTFVNQVADIAETAHHHPDINIRWNKVTLVLSTHSKGGLTTLDFELAKKIDLVLLEK